MGDAVSLTPLLRSAIASLDPNLAIYEVSSMRHVIGRQTWSTWRSVRSSWRSASALLLATAGLYGVMSFAVTQRTREMGVRSALGAKSLQLIALVMRRSVVQLAIGVGLGLVLAVFAAGSDGSERANGDQTFRGGRSDYEYGHLQQRRA
jgi:putative ABC transport system permease protein